MNSSERRDAILEELNIYRKLSRESLAHEFGVSMRTIERDILYLSSKYPVFTSQGNKGGIYVDKNWSYGKHYLLDEDEELLRRIKPTLHKKDQKRIDRIISMFGMPRKEIDK